MSNDFPFPPDCPVQPLGYSLGGDSQFCHYRDRGGCSVRINVQCHSVNALIALFGGETAWLNENFPRWVRSGLDGFDQPGASAALIAECARRGPFVASSGALADLFKAPEMPTCATAHIFAERKLRIIERTARGGHPIGSEVLERIEQLVDQAGLTFAFDALVDPVPF